eukprot:10952824-Lingulodinium_polyedra.AAC.1
MLSRRSSSLEDRSEPWVWRGQWPKVHDPAGEFENRWRTQPNAWQSFLCTPALEKQNNDFWMSQGRQRIRVHVKSRT